MSCWSVLTSTSSGSCDSALRTRGSQVRRSVEIVGLQGVLVLRIGLSAADADVLNRNEEEVGAGLVRKVAAQPRHDRVGRELAFGQRLQRDEEVRRVALARRR